MFEHINDLDFMMSQQRYEEALRAAEQERLLRAARLRKPGNWGLLWFVSILALLLGLATSACQSRSLNTAEAAPADPAQINEATFIATEYAYQGPERIPGGWSRLTLDNQGELPHDLILVKLGQGKSLDDLMAAFEAEGPPDWAHFYGNVTAEAGQSASYVVDLTPGNYAILSFGQAEDGPPDAAQGMIAALTVTEAQAEAVVAGLPQADAEVKLVDFSFVVNGGIEAGRQTLQVTNPGQEAHELVIYRLKEGATLADFRAALDQEMKGEAAPEGEPPVEEVGFTFMSPGVSTYITLDFEPGNHIFICHLPSPAHEMQPHFALGMIQEVNIQ
jgi:hypothetical protein